MADISTVTMPDGSVKDIKDSTAREALDGAIKIFVDSNGYVSASYPEVNN